MTSGRRRGRWVRGVALLLAVSVALAAGCTRGSGSDGSDSPTSSTRPGVSIAADELPSGSTAPTTPSQGLGEGFVAVPGGRKALRGFSEVAVTVTHADGTTCRLCLMAATTDAQRQRGLMEVTDEDLGGYDGVLFRFADDQDGAFWMRNTPMPLSIAYFDAAGRAVATKDMAPCEDSADCPSYPAGATFRYALEVPKGQLPDGLVDDGARLTIDSLHCPLADQTD